MQKQTAGALAAFLLLPLTAAAAERSRAVRPPAVHGRIVVGSESRIAATPDSPWLESVAVAMGSSSGIVLWTESSSIRFARLAADGHPIDGTIKPLLQNGHEQRHVAIDATRSQFVAAWCDIQGDKKQIVALRLDGNGRALDPAPVVVADNLGTSEPAVGVTCSDAGCLVSWGGDLSYGGHGTFSVGAVGARVLSSAFPAAGAALLLAPQGLGSGIGTDNLGFCTAYAEPVAYGHSGMLVAKFIAADGSASETDLLASDEYQVGTTWAAWSGAQWLILMLDLTTSGGLSREFRLLRVDRAGRPAGSATAAVLESAAVPALCPFVPDLFLYDPQSRRVVWDGLGFVVFTQRAIVPVGTDGHVSESVATDDYFPRSYPVAIASAGGGKTVAAYSRDSAVAIRAIDDVP